MNLFKKYINEKREILSKISKLEIKCENILSVVKPAILNGGKILTCGNGGSSCDAQHLTAELLIRLKPSNNRASIPSIFLGMDFATITAAGNDYGFKNIFSRPLKGIGCKNDILICFSTSGNSKNIIEALKEAKRKKIISISFLGKRGGIAKNYSDYSINVPSNNVMRIQEFHLFLVHYFAERIEQIYKNKK